MFYVCNLVIKFPSGVLVGFPLDLRALLIMFYCLETAAAVWHIKYKLLMFRCWHSCITPTSCEQPGEWPSESSTQLTCCRCAAVRSLTPHRTGRRTDETPRALLRVASSSSSAHRSWCCKTRSAEAGEDERENQSLLSCADYKITPLEEIQDRFKLMQRYKKITCWPQIWGTSCPPCLTPSALHYFGCSSVCFSAFPMWLIMSLYFLPSPPPVSFVISLDVPLPLPGSCFTHPFLWAVRKSRMFEDVCSVEGGSWWCISGLFELKDLLLLKGFFSSHMTDILGNDEIVLKILVISMFA